MEKEKDYEIIINATPVIVHNDTLTYEEIVGLAYPNQPSAAVSITFENAQSKPREGTLGQGASVTVKKNKTIFDVSPTNRS